MRFRLIKKRKTFYFRILILFLVGLAFYTWLLENKIAYLIIPFIPIIPLLISPYFFYKYIGEVELDENQLSVISRGNEPQTFLLNDIVRINLIYDRQKTNAFFNRFIVKGFVIKLEVESKENTASEYNILLKKNQREQFIELLEKLYKSGVRINERDELGAKCFLLKGNLSYKEIQEIKSKYNLSW